MLPIEATAPAARSLWLGQNILGRSFHQNRPNRIQGGLESLKTFDLRSAAQREYDPDVPTGWRMNEVRRPIIGLGDDDEPVVERRIIGTTGAHIRLGDVPGSRKPISHQGTLHRRQQTRWKVTDYVSHTVLRLPTTDLGSHTCGFRKVAVRCDIPQ